MTLSKLSKFILWLSVGISSFFSQAFAALPTVDKPQSGSDGTLYGDIKGYAQDGISLGAMILAAVAFLVVAVAGIASFKSAQETGRWSTFGVVVVVGVIMIVAVIWMAAKSSGILS